VLLVTNNPWVQPAFDPMLIVFTKYATKYCEEICTPRKGSSGCTSSCSECGSKPGEPCWNCLDSSDALPYRDHIENALGFYPRKSQWKEARKRKS
jgi:hypothetical protein